MKLLSCAVCVFILGMRYLYLGVLSVCLGMGVQYTYSSLDSAFVNAQIWSNEEGQ